LKTLTGQKYSKASKTPFTRQDTTELFSNNAQMLAWILIVALFVVILVAAVVIIKTLMVRVSQGKLTPR